MGQFWQKGGRKRPPFITGNKRETEIVLFFFALHFAAAVKFILIRDEMRAHGKEQLKEQGTSLNIMITGL